MNSAKLAYWARDNGVALTENGAAKIDQMLAAGVDLASPAEDWQPEGYRSLFEIG